MDASQPTHSKKRRKSPLEKKKKREAAKKKLKHGILEVKKEQHEQCQQNTIKQLSLASQLKRVRGTASTTPAPPEWSGLSSSSSALRKRYLSPNEDGDDFYLCQKESYNGFCWDEPGEIPSIVHERFDTALHSLNEAGLFLYDVVQPGGKKSTFTFVSRTLVGNPGSTYKYLGLRLFSHPWCAVDEDGDATMAVANSQNKKEYSNLVKLGYSKDCSKALITIGQLNQSLIERTKDKLNTEIAPNVENGLVGSADFTITLINKMEPTNVKKDLKIENIHGLGKTSVSWHKDSGLQDFSSIAVYHTFESFNNRQGNIDESPWKVALRVADQNSKTPALSVPLPSGACYYLLDDFNHQHEHAVISGSDTLRYSSTHRVAKDGLGGTWQSLRDNSKKILSSSLFLSLMNGNSSELLSYNSTSLKKHLVKEVRSYQQLMTELEFEWIRLWNIQGQLHANLHVYWHKPIEKMKQCYKKLKKVISSIYTLMQDTDKKVEFLSEELFDVLIEAIEYRTKLRMAWKERSNDKIFGKMPKIMRPINCDTFDEENELPTSKEIRKWRSDFVLKENSNSSTEAPKKKVARMTKKESKRVQSNWERLKSSLKKK